MRILHLSYDHLRNPFAGGGQAVHVHEVCSRLACDHSVTVLGSGWPGGPEAETVEGVLYRYAHPATTRVLSRVSYSVAAMLRAAAGDYDVLVERVSAFCPTLVPHVSRKPCIADVGLDPRAAAHKFAALEGVLTRTTENKLESFERFIVVSPSLATSLEGYGEVRVIPGGFDEGLLDSRPEKGDFFLFMGRLDIDHKGLDSLLAAFEHVHARRPDLRLVIAGRGADEQRVRHIIERKGLEQATEMVGYVRGQRKVELLRRCLALCLSSRREGWPLVCNEAAACAKPVIGFDIPGVRDAVVHDQTGWLVTPFDTEALGRAMLRIEGDEVLRNRLGRNARRRARSHTWKTTVRARERFYREVAGTT
jgi:glycosyltransferase involved in cell wall biosynthesis